MYNTTLAQQIHHRDVWGCNIKIPVWPSGLVCDSDHGHVVDVKDYEYRNAPHFLMVFLSNEIIESDGSYPLPD